MESEYQTASDLQHTAYDLIKKIDEAIFDTGIPKKSNMANNGVKRVISDMSEKSLTSRFQNKS